MKKNKKEIIIDSDVIIALLKGDENISKKLYELMDSVKVFITPVTTAEIMSGVRDNEDKAVQQLFDVLDVLEINKEIGKEAGRFLRPALKGKKIAFGSALIAASVKYFQFPLWTLNQNYYPMLDKNDFFEY